MTSIYGVARGRPPDFFNGNPQVFTGLRFHLEDEVFTFYQPVKMKDDPLWIDVTELIKNGQAGLGSVIKGLLADTHAYADRIGDFTSRLSYILGILDIDLHAEEITGNKMTIDVVVDIFDRVNSGGTKLSKGDLALAKICAEWPDARDAMNASLAEWEQYGFEFTRDWLRLARGMRGHQVNEDSIWVEPMSGQLVYHWRGIHVCLMPNPINGSIMS